MTTKINPEILSDSDLFSHVKKYMENETEKSKYVPIGEWNVSRVTNMSGLFWTNVDFNENINNWDVSNVKNMSNMFYNAEKFNQPLNNWNTSKVINMMGMFYNALSFNQPINDWDVSNVKHMQVMFSGAKMFNQPLNDWDTSNVMNMTSTFANAELFNQPLDKWNTSNVKTMANMFFGAKSFNQPINTWNVSNVKDMKMMFNEAMAFNQPLDSWDVSNVKDMTFMFSNSAFNQPLNSWDVSNVINMHYIFNRSPFNQTINNWRIRRSDISDLNLIFDGSILSPENKPIDYQNMINKTNDDSSLQNSSLQINPENETAIDYINMGDEVNVKQYLNEDEKNIVFYFNGKIYTSNKDNLKYLTTDPESKGHNVKFECKTIGSMDRSNIIMDVPYFTLKIIGLYGLASLSKITTIINSNDIRCIEITSQPIRQLVSTASFQATGNDPNYVGASHCQEGQGESVYDLLKINYSLTGGKNKRSKKRKITLKRRKRKTKKLLKKEKRRQTNKTRL